MIADPERFAVSTVLAPGAQALAGNGAPPTKVADIIESAERNSLFTSENANTPAPLPLPVAPVEPAYHALALKKD